MNETDADSPHNLFCWGISDGAAGHQSQVRGLAEAIQLPFKSLDCRLKFPWNLLPSSFAPRKASTFRSTSSLDDQPAPDVVISCGRQAALAAIATSSIHPATPFLICLQNPQANLKRFDLIITPEHDGLSGKNVISTLGAMHHLTTEKLQLAAGAGPVGGLESLTERFVTVLLGGPNRYFAFDTADIDLLSSHLTRVARSGYQLAIIPSRRTPASALKQITDKFASEHFVWDRTGKNPYLSSLALCSACIVTGDSVSMLSEATATGQPVYIATLNEKKPARKFHQLHQAFIERGYARLFEGEIEEWIYTPPNETQRVADMIQEQLRDRFLSKDA